MRVVGLLLISALMIVPVATAQLATGSFRATVQWSLVIGLVCAVGGVSTSYYADTPSGGTIVLLAIGLFSATALAVWVLGRWKSWRVRGELHA
jgi:zinc transport system permease protein